MKNIKKTNQKLQLNQTEVRENKLETASRNCREENFFEVRTEIEKAYEIKN